MARAVARAQYAESLIARPSENRNLREEIQKRIDLLGEAYETHDLVDEEITKSSEKVRSSMQGRIFNLNEDDNGVWAGNVWTPKRIGFFRHRHERYSVPLLTVELT